MFVHYLKIAARNIRKYALQNAISILGLAAGFVCLSLSAIWIHFEESFDTFQRIPTGFSLFRNMSMRRGRRLIPVMSITLSMRDCTVSPS